MTNRPEPTAEDATPSNAAFSAADITAVVIGRNEGERLARCLESLAGRVAAIVYVDSGSTDRSVALARGLGATVVELDASVPFTAARARNTGLRRVTTPLAFVCDGDCELIDGFLEPAAAVLADRDDVAIVCGQRIEREPNATIWNRLIAMEWARPAGEADACGGDALLRLTAIERVGRYADDLIAGEEPELCRRLQIAGFTIWRTADPMTRHDAAMTSWNQWWRRSVRSGHAYAEATTRHDGFRTREVRSIVLWAAVLPLVGLLLAIPTGGLSLAAVVGLLVVQIGRVLDRRRDEGDGWADAALFAVFCVLGKFAQLQGVAAFWRNRLRGERPQLIEYKQPAVAEPAPSNSSSADPVQTARERSGLPTIGYLTTEYPKPSHTFVRRELLALERRGWPIERFSIRPFAGTLADPADRREAELTTVLLDAPLRVIGLAAWTAVTRPVAFARALATTVSLWRQSQRSLLKHLAYLAEATVLVRECRAKRVRHLHVHFGKNSADVALLADVLGGPGFSMTIHGPGEFDASAPFALGEKVAASRFTAAISSFGTAQLRRWVAAAHWDKLNIVRCTIGDDFLTQLTPVEQTRAELVCVGRLTGQKGQLLLVEAVARLVREGVDLHLTLAGDGELRGPIEAAIAEHGLERNVTITGWIGEAEVRSLIRSSRALVLPSFAEGLPVAIMEALAMGRPVVSTMVAGIPELVRGDGPGRNGWLFPAGDVDAIADALREVAAADCFTLTQYGRAGHDAVARDHRTDTEAAKLDALLRQALRLPVAAEPGPDPSEEAAAPDAPMVAAPLA